MKVSNDMKSKYFEQISDDDFLGMVTCQSAIMLEQESHKEEQNHRREIVTDDKCVEQVKKTLPTSVKSESVNMGQDVFDDYEEVLVDEGIIIDDENVEIVTAEPVCIQNDECNDVSLNNNAVTMDIMPICSAGIVGLDKEYKYDIKDENGQLVSKKYKQYELISSHCARRTFITGTLIFSVSNWLLGIHQADRSTNMCSLRKMLLANNPSWQDTQANFIGTQAKIVLADEVANNVA